ncbi:MAG: transcription antitermination factor NusB [Fidelibacterota bacterium]
MTINNHHPRRQAREAVLQALYALEISEEPADKILKDILNREGREPETDQFIKQLFNQAIIHKDWCEELIIKRLNNWDFKRVALLDRLILIEAISEIFFIEDVPPKVSISEAIEIAKHYSTDESSSFVNGILDNIYKSMVIETENEH